VAAVASFLSAVLTEIDLCDVCSCQEILRRNGRGQPMAARGCQPLKPQLSVWGSTGQPYAPDMPRTREARLPPQIGAITTNPRWSMTRAYMGSARADMETLRSLTQGRTLLRRRARHCPATGSGVGAHGASTR
jgi:hypothetical protein